jgi:tetratricopeptide (TPR) repeat protein
VKRVNVRFLLLFLVGLAALAGATVALNRFQVMRNAGTLAKQARQRLEEGKQAEAMSLFARYLGMRPEDAEVHAEYAELVLERALAADATQGDLARAYNTLEEAVRRNPDKDPLRRKLAEFQLRIGRAVDAREHLDVLQSRLESGTIQKGTDDDPEAPAIDADTLQLLMAQSFAGAGDFDMAAKLAGDLIGFDMTQRVFDPAKKAADSTDAYILLASILQQRFSDPAAADGVLQELVTRRGTDAQAWLAMSRWHRQTAEFDAAAQDIEKAAAIAPNDINVVFGRFELALARLRRWRPRLARCSRPTSGCTAAWLRLPCSETISTAPSRPSATERPRSLTRPRCCSCWPTCYCSETSSMRPTRSSLASRNCMAR